MKAKIIRFNSLINNKLKLSETAISPQQAGDLSQAL